MSTATPVVEVPARRLPAGARPGHAPVRPRLLLPPVAEPAGRVPLADPPAPVATWSLLQPVSPVTSAAWPVPAPEPRAPEPLPDPTRLAGAVVVAAVEALRSVRPLQQLARWVSPAVYEALSRAVRPDAASGRRALVRRVRLCRLGPDVAEGSVVVHDGGRVRAAAVRLEAHRGSWRATVLQIG
jgi:hypothetical protein